MEGPLKGRADDVDVCEPLDMAAERAWTDRVRREQPAYDVRQVARLNDSL